jgi:hypothetical protein
MSQFSEHLGSRLRFSQPLQGLLTRYPISKSNLCLEKGLRVKDFMGFFAITKWVRPCPEIEKASHRFFSWNGCDAPAILGHLLADVYHNEKSDTSF